MLFLSINTHTNIFFPHVSKCFKEMLEYYIPDACVKKLSHRWTVRGIRTPDNSVREWGPLLPVLGIRPLLHGPLLSHYRSGLRTAKNFRILYSNAEQMFQDLLCCPQKSAVFAVCPIWMNHFLSLFSDKMGEWVAVTLSCVLRVWGPGGKGSAGTGFPWCGAAPAPLSRHWMSKW